MFVLGVLSGTSATCLSSFRMNNFRRSNHSFALRFLSGSCTCSCSDRRRFVYNVAQSPGQTTGADIIIVVDQTRSMEWTRTWLPHMVGQLESNLKSRGIGTNTACRNNYAVVAFGYTSGVKIVTDGEGRQLFQAEEIETVAEQLGQIPDPLGFEEDGYEAMRHALRHVPYRRCPSILHSLILVTDEDRDTVNFDITKTTIRRYIRRRGFSLNVIVNNTFSQRSATNELLGIRANTIYSLKDSKVVTQPGNISMLQGYFKTIEHYTSLALDPQLSGSAWNINVLSKAADNLETNEEAVELLTRVFTTEISDQSKKCRKCRCRKEGIYCTIAENTELCE